MGLLNYLIEQSKKPSGFIGKIMLKIMNRAHKGLTKWGLSQLKAGTSCLDIGCGGGNALKLLSKANLFEKLYGIDFSIDAVKLANKKNRKDIGTQKMFIQQASVLELPFSDSAFNAVTMFQTHYHLGDLPKALNEIYRVLNNSGQFVLVAENYKIKYHMKEYNTPESLEKLLLTCGFKSINILHKPKAICVIANKQ